MPLHKSCIDPPNEVLLGGVNLYSQYAFPCLPSSFNPMFTMNQLTRVAKDAGSINLNVLLNEERDRFQTAPSKLFVCASLRGFNELTKPESKRKSATHDCPAAMSRRKGSCQIEGLTPSGPQQGCIIERATARHRWVVTTNIEAIPRSPWTVI
jgi:hypothetical protein